MRWPWVSREVYERLMTDEVQSREAWMKHATHLQGEIGNLQASLAIERGRFDNLMEKYHALKLQGASEPQPIQPAPQREPDPVVQAINRASRGDPALRAQMLRQAEIDRRTMDDVDIVAQIESGVPAFLDGVPA